MNIPIGVKSKIDEYLGGLLLVKLYAIIWVNYNELTTTSLEIIVSTGKYPQIALIQVSELL